MGEHGDAYEGGSETNAWKHWWRAASALWQRVDGYYTLKSWATNYGASAHSFFNTYATKTYYDTPRAWVALHEDYSGGSLAQRNFTFYLDQFDANDVNGYNAQSQPEWGRIGDYDIASWNPTDDYRGVFVRRTSAPARVMAFHSIPDDDGNYYIVGGPYDVMVTVVYLDHDFGLGTPDTLSLVYYSASQGVATAWTQTKAGTNTWVTKTARLTDAVFDRLIAGGADFYIDDNVDGDEYIHWVSVEYATGGAS